MELTDDIVYGMVLPCEPGKCPITTNDKPCTAETEGTLIANGVSVTRTCCKHGVAVVLQTILMGYDFEWKSDSGR